MKETLKMERDEGQCLKRKYKDMLSTIEESKEEFQALQSNKDALVLSMNIIEGEKKYLENRIIEAVQKGDMTNKRIEELESQNLLLKEQLQVVEEKQMDITPFRNLASMLQKEINQVLLNLVEEMYKVKQMEDRLKEIKLGSTQFRRRLSYVVELVKNQLAGIETHSNFPADMPQKSVGGLKMEIGILNFGCRTTVMLNTAIEKTIEKCAEFYKGIHLVHKQCMILEDTPD